MSTTRRQLQQDLQNVGFTYREARRIVTVILKTMLTGLKEDGKLELPIGNLELIQPKPKRAYRFGKIVKTYTKNKVLFRKKE